MRLVSGRQRKSIGISFFWKNMLVYTVISVIPIVILTVIISSTMSSLLLKKETERSRLILNDLGNYFDNKYNLIYSITEQLYKDKEVNPGVSFYLENDLENDLETTDSNYLSYNKAFHKYFYSFFSRDLDIINLSIFKNVNRTLTLLSQNFEKSYGEADLDLSTEIQQISDKAPKITIYPAWLSEYNNQSRLYSLSINTKILGTNTNSGILRVDFSSEGISRRLAELGFTSKNGNILILTASGEVIFDSSDQYYGSAYPYLSLLDQDVRMANIEDQERIINTKWLDRSNVIVASVIPKQEILSDVYEMNKTILIICSLCVFAAILFTHVSAYFFSKRIKLIALSMNKIWSGNFSTRIHESRRIHDEVDLIAKNFNKMCDSLQEHIQRVYVSEIKQKTAEISALQAQMNPHFMYNTLEAIRMRAVMSNDKEVGNMIYMLANLFRTAIKGDSIVSVEADISYCRSYLELFKLRFENQLSVQFNVGIDARKYGIVKHLIQPVIENYVIHGFDIRNNNNWIRVDIAEEDAALWIRVSDNGIGIKQPDLVALNEDLAAAHNLLNRSHIGLRNVNERIRLIYGADYGVTVQSQQGVETVVTLKIAAKSLEELASYV